MSELTVLDRVVRGESATLDLDVPDKDGAPFAWVGWSVRFAAKRRLDDAEPAAITKSTDVTGEVDVSTPGEALVHLTPDDTKAAMAGTTANFVALYWDVRVSRPGANAASYVVASGILPVVRSVTSPPAP